MISLFNSLSLLRNEEIDSALKDKVFDSTEIQINTTIELLENLLKWAKTHGEGIQVKLEKQRQENDLIKEQFEKQDQKVEMLMKHFEGYQDILNELAETGKVKIKIPKQTPSESKKIKEELIEYVRNK